MFADNFFTSVHFAEALLQADTYLCGTTHGTRRDFPNALADAKLQAGESVKWTNEAEVMILKWHPNGTFVCMPQTTLEATM